MNEYNDNKENKDFKQFKDYDEYKYFLKDNERLSYKQPNDNRKKYRRFFFLGNVLLIVLIYFIIFKPAIEKTNNQTNNFSFTYELVDFNIKLFADKQNTVCDLFIKNNSDQVLLINKETISVEVFDIISKNKITTDSIGENNKEISIFQNEQKHVLYYIDSSIEKFYITLNFKGKEIYQSPIIEKEKLLYE